MVRSFDKHKPTISQTAFVADNASLIGQVSVEEDASIWYGAVLRGDCDQIKVGIQSNIQDNCILHSDKGTPCIVGDRVTVGHGAILHSCTIGSNCLIGMGAIVLNGAVIGDNCIIGAGALITKNTIIPEGSLVLGSPAQVKRPLSPEEIQTIHASVSEYVQLKDHHRVKEKENIAQQSLARLKKSQQ